MIEENIIFQYQVKVKTLHGIRYYYFYATTDIENYLNNKDIKYVRYTKDTVLNKQAKRIKELFKENKQLKDKEILYKEVIDELYKELETIDYDNFVYTKTTLKYNKEKLLQILDKLKEVNNDVN